MTRRPYVWRPRPGARHHDRVASNVRRTAVGSWPLEEVVLPTRGRGCGAGRHGLRVQDGRDGVRDDWPRPCQRRRDAASGLQPSSHPSVRPNRLEPPVESLQPAVSAGRSSGNLAAQSAQPRTWGVVGRGRLEGTWPQLQDQLPCGSQYDGETVALTERQTHQLSHSGMERCCCRRHAVLLCVPPLRCAAPRHPFAGRLPALHQPSSAGGDRVA